MSLRPGRDWAVSPLKCFRMETLDSFSLHITMSFSHHLQIFYLCGRLFLLFYLFYCRLCCWLFVCCCCCSECLWDWSTSAVLCSFSRGSSGGDGWLARGTAAAGPSVRPGSGRRRQPSHLPPRRPPMGEEVSACHCTPSLPLALPLYVPLGPHPSPLLSLFSSYFRFAFKSALNLDRSRGFFSPYVH